MVSEKNAARRIRDLKVRVDRLEHEQKPEAIPNPLRTLTDDTTTGDAISTSTASRGGMTWNSDDWSFAEWDKESLIATDTTLESFERTSPLAIYEGETSGFAENTSKAQDGSKSLEVTTHGSYQDIHTQNLTSPTQGDEFDFWFYTDSAAGDANYNQTGIKFAHNGTATGSGESCYRLFFEPTSDDFIMQVIESDSSTFLLGDNASTGGSLTSGWHRINCKWDDGSTFGGSAGDFTITLFNESGTQLSQHTGKDTTFDGTAQTGIGWRLREDDSNRLLLVDDATIAEN